MARWLLLLYRLPREPSGPRVALWRALKRLEEGALVQDGVFALPCSELHEEALENLAHDVRNDGGEASVVVTASVDDERHWKARLAAATAPPRDQR